MKKNITPKLSNIFTKKEKMVVAPSIKILDFLKLFSRTYYVEKSLPNSLNEVCVN